jgi:hypothetical protein
MFLYIFVWPKYVFFLTINQKNCGSEVNLHNTNAGYFFHKSPTHTLAGFELGSSDAMTTVPRCQVMAPKG